MSLEVSKRRERRIQRRTKDAKFPLLKTLDGFDFSKQPKLDQSDVLELFDGAFVEEARNVVLMGPVGTGKTHLAIALGIACCQQERRVRFTTAAELTNMLVEAKKEGRLGRKLEQLARFDLVVLDELGYVPFDKESANLLFSFITKVYERRSLVVTTNLPFSRWTEVFGDATAAAAVIDRIVHHSSVFKTEGGSYRLQAAKKNTRKRKTSAARS
jgi:DNA replication protein DnaC